ncbi:MAG: hypothetical protein NTX71_05970 [Candidatus Aureabacteria bacterium]|nr:hypothetical protein [Candidatus Auribacterota bacterium]
MVKMRIYSEISLKANVPLKDVDARTRDYDVQRHKKEVYDYLQERLAKAFADAHDLTVHYFEFSVAQE